MSLVVTDAIVLHAADYLESSRILRLATRDAGVQSVLARGARGSRKRFGGGLDLFVEGEATLQLRPGRELQTLTGFEVTRVHTAIAGDLERFAAAAAFAAVAVRVVADESVPAAFEAVVQGVRRIAAADGGAGAVDAVGEAVGALWGLAAVLGVGPVLDECAACHATAAGGAPLAFSARAGGVLCDSCAAVTRGVRRLPAAAREALRGWLAGASVPLTAPEGKAHRRLLREFLAEHLTDPSALRAWGAWEGGVGGWNSASPGTPERSS
jgi:DNA repair protein RecO (recombination protein O)